MTEILTTSGAVKIYAGANVSTALTAANYTQLIKDAEGVFCTNAKYDLVTNYSSINAIGKAWLSGAVACLAAFNAIGYDPSGYTNGNEAQFKSDQLYTQSVEALNLIRDDKFRTFIGAV